jgi:hypothetical protein
MSEPFLSLTSSLSGRLKPLGFKKRGYRFCLLRNNCALIVEIQKSRERHEDGLVGFYINVGACSLAIVQVLYPEVSIEWPAEMYAQVRERARHGPGFEGELWTLSVARCDERRIEHVSDAVLRMIEAMLPLLDEDALMAALNDQSTGISSLERLESLAVLAGRVKDSATQRSYLEQVRDALVRAGHGHAFTDFESRALALAKV